jgi:hypothetical protein
MINSKNINDLQPYVKYLAQKLITEAEKQGLKVLVTSTLRDDEYQAYLYSLGRTKPGQIVTNLKKPAAHGKGLAFDICQNIKGHEWEDGFFDKIGKIGVSIGLEWGGNWKTFVDKPHFQYIQGLTNDQIRNGMMPNFPEIPTEKLDYLQILKLVSSNYEEWKVAIQTAIGIGKSDSNLGVLKIFEFFPMLLEKIYNSRDGSTLQYKEILIKVASNPTEWDSAINIAVQAAKDKSDLGSLEIFQFLPILIEKIYCKGADIK